MAKLWDQSGAFADHMQKLSDMPFQVKVDASESVISGDLTGIGSFTDQANGELDLDMSELGEVERVLELEVTPDSGTATISSSIDSNGLLTISVDSSLDLTSSDVVLDIKLVVKRKL